MGWETKSSTQWLNTKNPTTTPARLSRQMREVKIAATSDHTSDMKRP